MRSRWRADRQPIEFNGIDPDVEVEAVPEEVKAGYNSAILRAQQYLLGATQERTFNQAEAAQVAPDGKTRSQGLAGENQDGIANARKAR